MHQWGVNSRSISELLQGVFYLSSAWHSSNLWYSFTSRVGNIGIRCQMLN